MTRPTLLKITVVALIAIPLLAPYAASLFFSSEKAKQQLEDNGYTNVQLTNTYKLTARFKTPCWYIHDTVAYEFQVDYNPSALTVSDYQDSTPPIKNMRAYVCVNLLSGRIVLR